MAFCLFWQCKIVGTRWNIYGYKFVPTIFVHSFLQKKDSLQIEIINIAFYHTTHAETIFQAKLFCAKPTFWHRTYCRGCIVFLETYLCNSIFKCIVIASQFQQFFKISNIFRWCAEHLFSRLFSCLGFGTPSCHLCQVVLFWFLECAKSFKNVYIKEFPPQSLLFVAVKMPIRLDVLNEVRKQEISNNLSCL